MCSNTYSGNLRWLWSMNFLLCTLLLVACTSASPPTTTTTKATKQTTPIVTPTSQSLQPLAYSCQIQQTPIHNQIAGLGSEIRGKANNVQLWALVQSSPRAESMVKIVWRMTGEGNFSLVALGPQGKRILPDQGPEAHGGSNWNKPGDEWGSVFIFPIQGCWDLHATRGSSSGDVWLNIVS